MLDVAHAKFLPHEQVIFFDKEMPFREVHRTLRHGGCYLFNVWGSEHYNPFARLSFEVLKQFFPSDTPRFLFNPISCHAIDPIKEILTRSGFDRIVILISINYVRLISLELAKNKVDLRVNICKRSNKLWKLSVEISKTLTNVQKIYKICI